MTAHPARYPIHKDPAKGQTFNGECNITRCTNQHATFFNLATYGLYCPNCAREINWQKHKPPMCIPVTEMPAVEDMDELRKTHHYYEAL